MKAVIKLDVPDWQIGKEVSVYFPDTMMKHGICKEEKELLENNKVIEGLKHCRKYGALSGNDCSGHYEYTDNLQEIIKANNHRIDCPYGKCKTGCVVTLIDDVLNLLK